MSEDLNHSKLAKFHFALASFYLIIFILAWKFFSGHNSSNGRLLVIAPLLLTILHTALGFGAKVKNEISRKISVAIGVMMIFAFPIGTFLAFYFLPYTEWNTTSSDNGDTHV